MRRASPQSREGATRKLPFPAESFIAGRLDRADLADCYAITLPAGCTSDIDALAHAALGTPPGWVRGLMALRDGAVVGLGLKTSRSIKSRTRGDRINFFPVQARSAHELILGEDDRHLDFRVSVLRRPCAGGEELAVSTLVHCHNRLGRVYLFLIMPFHKLIVRASLRRAWRVGRK